MLRAVAESVDAYRIWYKVTFQRGRILQTRGSDWEALGRPELLDDPSRFYACDGRVPDVRMDHESRGPGWDVERFRFPSPAPITAYPCEESNVSQGRRYRLRADPGAPVVVLAHGWAHDRLRPIEKLYVEPLLRAGFSVAVPSLPLHLGRTPRGTSSGELMVSGDVVLTAEAFRQGVADLLGVVSWLRDTQPAGGRPVGLLGYSLGGYLAGLAACLREDLDFVVVGGAGHSVVSPILDTGLGVNVREDLSWSGMHRRENLERAWGIISPGRLSLRVPKERVLLVAGLYDRIMLPGSVRELWRRWGEPPLRWEPQGHYTLLAVPGRLVRRSRDFIRKWSARPS